MYRSLQSKMASENSDQLNSQFINKVVQLPAVLSALGYATNMYEMAKGSNSLVNMALVRSEQLAKAAVTQVSPLANRFKPQIEAIDNLACKGFDTIELKIPAIGKQPEEIYNSTRKFVNVTLEPAKLYSTNTVENIRAKAAQVSQASYTTAARLLDTKVGKLALNGVDSVLSTAENYVDYYLPSPKATEGKGEQGPNPANTEEKMAYSVRKALRISQKTYSGALEKLHQAQETTKALTLQINLVQFAHNLNPTVLTEQAQVFWANILAEQQDGESSDSPAMLVTRQLARRLVGVYSSAYTALQGVPVHARGTMDEALKHANDIYTSILKATKTEELANSLASQLKGKLGTLQKLLVDIQSSASTWVVTLAQNSQQQNKKMELNGHGEINQDDVNRLD